MKKNCKMDSCCQKYSQTSDAEGDYNASRRSFMQLAAMAPFLRFGNSSSNIEEVFILRGLHQSPTPRGRQDTAAAWREMLGKCSLNGWKPQSHSLVMKVDGSAPLCLPHQVALPALLNTIYDMGLTPDQLTAYSSDAIQLNRVSHLLESAHGQCGTFAINSRDRQAAAKAKKRITGLSETANAGFAYYGTAMVHQHFGFAGTVVQSAVDLVPGLKNKIEDDEQIEKQIIRIWRQFLKPVHRFSVLDMHTVVADMGPAGCADHTLESDVILLGTDPVAVDSVAHDLLKTMLADTPFKMPGRKLITACAEAGIGTDEPRITRMDFSRT